MVFFPMIFTNAAIKMTLWFFSYVLLGPCMALLWRTRRYLADAGAVQLTRSPDGLASALQALNADDTSIPGGGWGAHLFLINPGHDRSMASARPSPAEVQQAIRAWRESLGESQTAAQPGATAESGPADFAAMMMEIRQVQRAAMGGDAQAIARMKAFGTVITTLGGPAAGARSDSSELPGQSMVSFHPPLKRRLTKLKRMGAHVEFGAPRKKPLWASVFVTILYLILAPLMLVAGAAMLAGIVIMIGLNLLFLALWMAVIHFIFTLIGHR
jgi:Zn-dependent protease with chaperone function